MNEQRLQKLSRRELQELAKANHIRANLKSKDIVRTLLELDGPIQGLDSLIPAHDSQLSVELCENDVVHDSIQDERSIQSSFQRLQDEDKPISLRENSESSDIGTQEEAELAPERDSNSSVEKQTDEAPVATAHENPSEDAERISPESALKKDSEFPAKPTTESKAASDASHIVESNLQESASISGDPESELDASNVIPIVSSHTSVADVDDAVASSPVVQARPNAGCLQSHTETACIDENDSEQAPNCQTRPSNGNHDGNDDRGSSMPKSATNLPEPTSESPAPSENQVQDALKTFRQIAMQSNAELDAHGCDVPEPSSSGKLSPPATARKQPVVATAKKTSGKTDSAPARTNKTKFDLQESLSRPVTWEMKKGPLPPVSVQVLEDPNRLCLWSPSRMAERKKEFKNNDFGGTKRRIDGYMADGRSKLNETVRDLRKAADTTSIEN